MKGVFKLNILKNIPGIVKLKDGTILVIRTVITIVKEIGRMPTGLELGIGYNVLISALSPAELREKVKEKPIPRGDEHTKKIEIWEFIDIEKSVNAREEALYYGSDGIKYHLILEIEPTIISRTLEFKDKMGNPIYHVRWSPHLLIKKWDKK